MNWNIDPSHSLVQFSVRHMMISNVRGRFETFTGNVSFDGKDLATLRIDVTIDPASINTRDEKRDGHLKSPDFFSTEEYPTLTFKSKSVETVGEDRANVLGDLTIHGVTHSVTLDVELNGVQKSPWGTTSAGFSAHTKVNRKDFGLVWNQTLEAGGILVGEDVKIEIDLELVQEAVAVEA